MADLVSNVNACSGGEHLILSGLDDGSVWSGLAVPDSALLEPLTPTEVQLLRKLLLRKLRQSGVPNPAAMIGRVVRGVEATNMKVYDLIAPGAAITKTNIGTSYVNISPRLNGERTLIDFTGCTQYRLVAFANLVGTGQWGLRVVRDSDSAVLHENANLGAAGERELDTDWQALPAQAAGLIFVRVQGKSTTGADDPVFGSVRLAVR